VTGSFSPGLIELSILLEWSLPLTGSESGFLDDFLVPLWQKIQNFSRMHLSHQIFSMRFRKKWNLAGLSHSLADGRRVIFACWYNTGQTFLLTIHFLYVADLVRVRSNIKRSMLTFFRNNRLKREWEAFS